MTSSLVVVKKVCFGTPEFMFLRRDMDILLKKRNSLKPFYKDNEAEYRHTNALICNMASLVYFKRNPRIKRVYVPVVAPPPIIKTKDKKAKAKFIEPTKTLFDT